MPFNGSGVYTAPAADFPVVTQTVISSTHFNNTINDIATALSICLTKDGQQTATANINFGGFRATNVGITAIAGSVGTPAINVSDTGTGLYRSAASELAVTVAGSQVARFVSTGLIVTGAASVSTTLTATTSIVAPLIGNVADTVLGLMVNNGARWNISTLAAGVYAFYPTADNANVIGGAANRVSTVYTPIIDSGTTGSLSFRTNNGVEQVKINHTATADVPIMLTGGKTAVQNALLSIAGAVSLSFINNATNFNFYTGNAEAAAQLQVLHTASATRNITVTGSNGGNPTISTTAGSLAITPAVVMASTLVVSGASLSIGTNPATSGNAINIPFGTGIATRNQANNNNQTVFATTTVNGVNDVLALGDLSLTAGVYLNSARRAGLPSVSDLLAGGWTLWKDTSGGTVKIYYNDGGSLKGVALV